MTKTKLERAIERRMREDEKARRANQLRGRAKAVVDGAQRVSGFRIMDAESESVLENVLEQYDGNEGMHVSFDRNALTRSLSSAAVFHCEKLQQYGAIVSYFPYSSDDIEITLSSSGLSYFHGKQEAIERDRRDRERKERLETDYVKVQGMSLEQLREIYLQAVMVNSQLNESVEVQKKQLETQERQLMVLKNLFASGEDGVAVQKEIMRLLEESEDSEVADLVKGKLGDLGVAAVTASVPVVLGALKIWLNTQGFALV